MSSAIDPRDYYELWSFSQREFVLTPVASLIAVEDWTRIEIEFHVPTVAGSVGDINQARVSMFQGLIATSGFAITQSNPIRFDAGRTGPCSAHEWWGITTFAAITVTVLEVFYRPKR